MGRCLPERIVTNDEMALKVGRSADWILSRTGVRTRRWVVDETAPKMAAEASREAIERAGLRPDEIDFVLNASGTPWQVLPDGSTWLQRELGLECAGCSVHSTCLSFVSALQIGASLLAAGQAKTILVSVSEICSRALDFESPETAALFGDGAVSAILQEGDGEESVILNSIFRTFPEGCEFTQIRGGGSRRHPDNPETVRTDNLFQMQGSAILRLAREKLPIVLEELQPGLSTGVTDVDRFFPHQASRLGLSILNRFGWTDENMEMVLPELGNVVAASIPLCLYQALEEGRLHRGDKILLLGTGAGFSVGVMLLRF